MDQVKFFKSWLLQILIGPFLNTLTHMPYLHNHFLIIIFIIIKDTLKDFNDFQDK